MNSLTPQPAPQPGPARLAGLWRWLVDRAATACRYDTFMWKAGSLGIAVCFAMLLAITAMGIPTGLGYGVDAAILVTLGLSALWLVSRCIALLLALIGIPVPRFFAGCFLAAAGGTYAMFHFAEIGWQPALLLSVIAAVSGSLAGWFTGLLVHPRLRPGVKWTAAGLALIIALASMQLSSYGAEEAGGIPVAGSNANITPIQAGNPAEKGPYKVKYYTYGSGDDRHREEFGSGTDWISETVDAGAYITRWPKLRTWFWGFDQSALPLNGRLWMPEGEGPFPLVLIVHGNHLMEDWSDGGYRYIGELLASRGFIAVSVDENFLNYSVWSGIPNQDMKMRAWMLLHHLQQIQAFNLIAGHPLGGKVDLERVGLIGHSRGGQAVAMAADASRWFDEDPLLESLQKVQIKAVAALAPTDRTVDKKSAYLRDVHYLTIQGARDADVNNFYGEQQYNRASFSKNKNAFKAAVYLPDANHSRFNSDWGSYDLSMPGGMLLDISDVMSAEDQRLAAQVYLSAFMETALHGREEYERLFADYRTGKQWLPAADYITRYESGAFKAISRFEQPALESINAGVTAYADGADSWYHGSVLNRDGKDKGTDALVLKWNSVASYSISFVGRYWQTVQPESVTAITFSVADLSHELKEAAAVPGLIIEVEGQDGHTAAVPLNAHDVFRSPPSITYTIHPFLERKLKKGKYKQAIEPVFQTYTIPVSYFKKMKPDVFDGGLSRLTIRLMNGPGRIMIDDLGFNAMS
ncbi:alpha/beta hydrolase family protein [Paenibacillus tarimensis]|uniref:poly(ethylene terephthalate) hydrolase family protein n=1 Tax=Paenibacillus tarimensis TaxID=416012 RepID=UPI001F288612|nr:alpha/beta hydrolase [Paenibacillus tarimensis]MCF2944828.1 alpha/beta hydrolase [Paenibacillus tarimensis]